MPVLPPGLNIMKWLSEHGLVGQAGQSPDTQPDLRELGMLEDYRSGINRMGQGAPASTPGWLDALAHTVSGAAIMRGGIGQGPRWLRNPAPINAAGEAVRIDVTPAMLTAAKAGDQAARGQVVDALQNMVAKVANQYVRAGRPTAEFNDLMAEGNTAILQVLDKAEMPKDFLPYVRAAIDHRIRSFSLSQTTAAKLVGPVENIEQLSDPSLRIPDVPRSVINEKLNAAMATLTPKQREAVTMRLGLGEADPMTLREIAGVLGKDHKAVQANYVGGLKKLQETVKNLGLEPSDLVPERQMPPPSKLTKPVSEGSVPGPVTTTVPPDSRYMKNALPPTSENPSLAETGLNFATRTEQAAAPLARSPEEIVLSMRGEWTGIKNDVAHFAESETGIPLSLPLSRLTPQSVLDTLNAARKSAGLKPLEVPPIETNFSAPGIPELPPGVKPIGGGSVDPLTPLGERLAANVSEEAQGGGFHVPPKSPFYAGDFTADFRLSPFKVERNPGGTPVHPGGVSDSVWRGDVPHRLVDLSRDPDAINAFMTWLDQARLGIGRVNGVRPEPFAAATPSSPLPKLELSGLGKGLEQRLPDFGAAGGSKIDYPASLRPGYSGPPERFTPKWPLPDAPGSYPEDVRNVEQVRRYMRGIPGDQAGSITPSEMLDLQNDPEAIKRFLNILDQYHRGSF